MSIVRSSAGVTLPNIVAIVKKADESITSSATLHNDNTLFFPVGALTTYFITGRALYETTAAADFQPAFAISGTVTSVRVLRWMVVPAGAAFVNVAIDTTVGAGYAVTTNVGGTGLFAYEIYLVMGASGGIFNLQWAQNTIDAGTTTVRAGSVVQYTGVGQ